MEPANEVLEANEVMVKCEVCLKEVPRSEAKSAEAVDYVVHFCGLDCYEEWNESQLMLELKLLSD